MQEEKKVSDARLKAFKEMSRRASEEYEEKIALVAQRLFKERFSPILDDLFGEMGKQYAIGKSPEYNVRHLILALAMAVESANTWYFKEEAELDEMYERASDAVYSERIIKAIAEPIAQDECAAKYKELHEGGECARDCEECAEQRFKNLDLTTSRGMNIIAFLLIHHDSFSKWMKAYAEEHGSELDEMARVLLDDEKKDEVVS